MTADDDLQSSGLLREELRVCEPGQQEGVGQASFLPA